MSQPETLGSFFRENKTLAKEYIETRLKLYRLQTIRVFAKTAGHLSWILVALFLGFLILLFGGMVMAYWLSELTGSHVKGFGITTLFLLFLFGGVVLFRKQLFVRPIIETIIRHNDEPVRENNPADQP